MQAALDDLVKATTLPHDSLAIHGLV